MARIGLIDLDSHRFPNLALMKISALLVEIAEQALKQINKQN